MARRIQDFAAGRVTRELVGRDAELESLRAFLTEDRTCVLHVHGIGGTGKTSLLLAFSEAARQAGWTVAFLDCRGIEPNEQAFLAELQATLHSTVTSIDDVAERLSESATPVLLILDTYEVFRSMDTWLRLTFVPQLPDNVFLMTSGREPPVPAWFLTPGWQGLVSTLEVGPISELNALTILQQSGMSVNEARRINRVSRGHPLALQLATSIDRRHTSSDLEGAAISRVVRELTRIYLDEIDDPLTRQILGAGSVVRRLTISLLSAMLPDISPEDGMERIRSLPLVEQGRDGLHIHDVVQQAISIMLRSDDPARYRAYRRAAWKQLQSEVRSAGKADLWRYTADMLFLLENPIVREAFFPTGSQQFAVEPARPEDLPAIRAISVRHERQAATRLLESHYQREPQTLWTIRSPDDEIAGYFAAFDPAAVSRAWMRSDPVLRAWLDHLERNPVPRSQQVLFVPRLLSEEYGEAPSPVQAGAWLETKRLYMEMRPRLRRVYFSQRDLDTPWPALEQLGFQRISGSDVEIGDTTYYSAMLDFGPNSVDGWLTGLVATELGIEEDQLFDTDSRELVIDGRRIGLTRLEFGVMQYLHSRQGHAVSRADLLENIWDYHYQGGSNVVDVVIRSLRKKTGACGIGIETVRGVGYRLRLNS